jgi:E3 ubiquitin-protein ligase FANCL
MTAVLLLPNHDFSEWEGFFGQQQMFFIRIVVSSEVAKTLAAAPRRPVPLSGAAFQCDHKLAALLSSEHRRLVEQRLNASLSIDAFLLELTAIVRPLLLLQIDEATPSWNGSTSKLLADLERVVGWSNVVHIDPLLDNVHVRLVDDAQRAHVIQLHFRDDYPRSAPTVRAAALPVAIDVPPSAATLRDVVAHCAAHIAQFQAVWRVLDEFDARCCVLEPPVPSAARDVLARRIALGAHRTLSLLVDWQRPSAMPRELTLFGPDATVRPLRERLAANGAQQWNGALSLADNLAVDSRHRAAERQRRMRVQELAIECGICYAYRNNDDVPNAACNNERCGRAFHEACLFEWLRSIPSNTMTFDTIFGVCPYCSEKLSATARKR